MWWIRKHNPEVNESVIYGLKPLAMQSLTGPGLVYSLAFDNVRDAERSKIVYTKKMAELGLSWV